MCMWTKEDIIHESRWSRLYAKASKPKHQYGESRFMDGSATITLEELKRDWHEWPEHEQIDFCQSFVWAQIPERNDILRFILANGNHHAWSAIALQVATDLPADESIPALRKWCESCQVGHGSNYYQALAHTGDPEAHAVLKSCLERIRNKSGFLDEGDEWNWAALDAMWCVKHLLELNEDVTPLRETYDQLKNHPCKCTRQQTRRWLQKHFEAHIQSTSR